MRTPQAAKRYVRMEWTLQDVKADIVRLLSDAASNRNSPMHTPVVATADADARVMVLREFDAENGLLRFHTDARSPKVSVIGNGAPVAVLFYDQAQKVQLRCRGLARIELDSDLARKAWQGSDAFARRCYLGAPPGEERDKPSSGLPSDIEGRRPSEEQLGSVRENFAVLLVTIETMDWYHLSSNGHRRAVFADDEGKWITP